MALAGGIVEANGAELPDGVLAAAFTQCEAENHFDCLAVIGLDRLDTGMSLTANREITTKFQGIQHPRPWFWHSLFFLNQSHP
jgi:hypothetical protein